MPPSLDPRTKLFLGAAAITVVLSTHRPMVHGVEAGLLSLGLWGMGMIGPWVRGLRLMAPMVALVFAISLLSFDLQTALVLSLRLFNLLTVSFVFFRAMTPEEVGNGLRKMGMPYGFSFILSTAMRYVPLIGRRIRLVMEAQASRGIDLRPRIRNAGNFMALLMPLLVQSFLLAEELAMAMEARGFGLKGRSFRKIYRIRPGEYIIMLGSLGFLVLFFLWERG
ncbi:MAG: energy-coupling factor transporter transmembrane protein EcfT [Deltaproteobacteria bacterium]|nr:energy-coupling factor transporter transmembrane protein EcfT [Deltaproteobacteria bacterium]